MNKFIEITTRSDGDRVFVNLAHVEAVFDTGESDGCLISGRGNNSLGCKESYEEIKALISTPMFWENQILGERVIDERKAGR